MKVTLKDSKTGEVKTIDRPGEDPYMWEDGNYSCDCNRSLFFYGLKIDESFPCGNARFELVKLEE